MHLRLPFLSCQSFLTRNSRRWLDVCSGDLHPTSREVKSFTQKIWFQSPEKLERGV